MSSQQQSLVCQNDYPACRLPSKGFWHQPFVSPRLRFEIAVRFYILDSSFSVKKKPPLLWEGFSVFCLFLRRHCMTFPVQLIHHKENNHIDQNNVDVQEIQLAHHHGKKLTQKKAPLTLRRACIFIAQQRSPLSFSP